MPEIVNKYTQILHKDCGGAIMMVANKENSEDVYPACEKCNKMWMTNRMRVYGNMELFIPR